MGAQLFGGRWNEKGVPALYASSSLSLAALEILVHTYKNHPPVDMAYAEIYVPDTLLTQKIVRLGEGENLLDYGTTWLRQKSGLFIKVPSIILPYEYEHDFNVILNPLHPDYKQIFVASTHDFSFDMRFWG